MFIMNSLQSYSDGELVMAIVSRDWTTIIDIRCHEYCIYNVLPKLMVLFFPCFTGMADKNGEINRLMSCFNNNVKSNVTHLKKQN